jgi:serine protease Do
MRHVTLRFPPRLRFPRHLAFVFALLTPACAPAQTASSSMFPPSPDRMEVPGTAAALDLGNAFAAAAEELRPTVVFIRAEMPAPRRATREGPPRSGPQATRTSTGTGFIVSSDGLVVTNHHVIAGSRRIRVRLFDHREYTAEVVGVDATTDIAVLRIPQDGLPVAILGDSDRLRVGEWVLAIGNPLGSALSFSVTAGIVSATARSMASENAVQPLDYIQTDAVANFGNSGGPLLDLHGRIMGMNSAIISTTGSYQGYTLAIPSSLLAPVISELIRHGSFVRSGLGVRVDEATIEDAAVVQLDSVHGVVVHDVELGERLAERAGLRPGDVIMAVDGHPVRRTGQLQRQVWFRRAGETVQLDVRRDGGVQAFVTVPLVSLDAPAPVVAARREDYAPPAPCAENPLGVCVTEVAGRDGSPASAQRDAGLLVDHVLSGGPSGGKLVPGLHVITHVNGRAVDCLADLRDALEGSKPGDIVSVQTYQRDTSDRAFNRLRLG